MTLYNSSAAGPTTGNTPIPVRDINGGKLAKRLRKGLSPTHRALLANDLQTGAVYVHHLTRRQALALTWASVGYVNTVAKLSPEQREQVASGKIPLSVFHNRPKTSAFAALARAANEVEVELGDEDISVGDFVDRVLAKIGDSLLAALDRLTVPAVTAANDNAAATMQAAE